LGNLATVVALTKKPFASISGGSSLDNIINDKEKNKYIQDLKETLSKTTDAELQKISATL